jgi:DNA-binding GntR family transcriptional regulator
MLHKTIIELAGHRRLAKQYRVLEHQFRVLIGSSNALVLTTGEVVAQHRPIVEAILAGQAARAEKLAGAHSLDEGALVVAHVEQSRRRSENTSSISSPKTVARQRARTKSAAAKGV